MSILNILNSPWAIERDKLAEIRSIYESHAKGEKADIAEIEARIGKPLSNDQQGYTVTNGVAIVPMHGVMGKKMNMFSQISGGASTQLVARDIQSAVNDNSVDSIILHIDSPGGAVDGTQSLEQVIKEAKQIKPVVALADGSMASAAYWVGSAADLVVASSDTSQIGSIGVVSTHTDTSKAQESAGVKVTEITAGKYKRIASNNAPLSDAGKAEIQDHVDQIYSIFVDSVADNRGVSTDTVLEDMADGRVFLAKQAKRRGLIDHIASLDQTILNMSSGVWPMTAKAKDKPEVEADTLTMEMVKEKYPDIAIALMDEGKAEGAKAERERIQACENAGLQGHEEIVNAMKYDGKSTAADVALAIVNAEKKVRADSHADFVASAPPVLSGGAVVGTEKAEDSLSIRDKASAEWESDAGLRKRFSSKESYIGFMEMEAANGKA